jgi:hypothetical protein
MQKRKSARNGAVLLSGIEHASLSNFQRITQGRVGLRNLLEAYTVPWLSGGITENFNAPKNWPLFGRAGGAE